MNVSTPIKSHVMRNKYLKTILIPIVYLCFMMVSIAASLQSNPLITATTNPKNQTQRQINFNSGWEFVRIDSTINIKKQDSTRTVGSKWNDQFMIEVVDKAAAYDSVQMNKTLNKEKEVLSKCKWEKVCLPHTSYVEPLIVVKQWEGVSYYRKTFDIDRSLKGKCITIEFEGAMQTADVWFNGKHVKQHLGGYTPFTIDITNAADFNNPNTIIVRLDNHVNPLVPPGKQVDRLDFLYYSGIYRDVWMHITNPLHITDAVEADKPAGGGIFVWYDNVTDESAKVNIKTHIKNEDHKQIEFKVVQELIDDKGNIVVKTESENININFGEDKHVELSMIVNKPSLWHPDHPYLYTLNTIIQGAETLDEKTILIGIRTFSISRDKGLLINGKPFRIVGSNRHMSYPYIGNALSNNANYRDMWLFKNAGMNCVRLAHYPQDLSVYDACDKLGILVLDCIPGWQYFNNNPLFANNVLKDIRTMIRRDRNHPCVLLWEASLNETYPSAEFRCKQADVAKSEFIGNNFFTSGDSYFTKACWDVPYDDWNDNPACRDNYTYKDNAFLVREYGDCEFGCNVTGTSRKLRGEGEAALLQQAWNHQWGHNNNRFQYPRCIGDLTWAFYDGVCGTMVCIESWGSADIFRIPKFSYYFFQSQRDPNIKQPLDIESGPMVYIANYWTKRESPAKVVVYSNCDEVELFVNNKSVAKQKPDNGKTTPYGTDFNKGGNPFDGGNCLNLDHPPFTFNNIKYEEGELMAKGFIKGKAVAEYKVHTAKEPHHIKLEAASNTKPLAADGSDEVFVRAYILDKDGNLVTNATNKVSFKVNGVAEIIGSSSEINAEAGIASILIKSTSITAGEVIIKAVSDNLKEAILIIK